MREEKHQLVDEFRRLRRLVVSRVIEKRHGLAIAVTVQDIRYGYERAYRSLTARNFFKIFTRRVMGTNRKRTP